MRVIFSGKHNVGLKFNTIKFSLGLKDVPCLGYIINQEGTKPDPMKVKIIMDIVKPTTKTEPLTLIGMVQYYKDMCLRFRHDKTILLILCRRHF